MDKEDKRKMEEYKKNPTTNLADSINYLHIGDLRQLTKGKLLIRIIVGVIIIAILALILYKIVDINIK